MSKPQVVDSRFPNQNQAMYCWALYNEYILCRNANKGDETPCRGLSRGFFRTCPADWMDEWNEQRGEAVFNGIKDKYEVVVDDDDDE